MMEMKDDVSPLPSPSGYGKMEVKVTKVDRSGEIVLDNPTVIPQHAILPLTVKLPIPNDEAYGLVVSKLSNKTFTWSQKVIGPVKYNIFFDIGENMTYTLYKDIVGMLANAHNPIGLPKEGTCRISPICHSKKPYVQPEPVYVDTIQYVIYLTLEEQNLRNLMLEEQNLRRVIAPAADVDVGKIYIFSDGEEYYRVKLLETNLMPEPTPSKDSRRNPVSREKETTVSTSCTPVEEDKNVRVGVVSVCGVEIDDFITTDNEGSIDTSNVSQETDTTESTSSSPVEEDVVCVGVATVCGVDIDDRITISKGVSKDTSGGSNKKTEREKCVYVAKNPFDREDGEMVEAFRIDYGGPSITIHRADLYTVDDVCKALNRIPELAFQVTVRMIDDSDKDKDARFETLRSQQGIIGIKTVVNAAGGSPAQVDIFS